jgi:1,2-phenylacetyl-CoA epoxidase catalytic subunit
MSSVPASTTGAPAEAAATAAMASLVASLADNKAALGRRYGEWAVSAPTLESAVAAAAMAQDELGHARSTYPVIKQLDPDAAEEAGGDRCLPLLDEELPDWSAFVAANLVVDGVLSTFVAACRDSSIEPLAQRARKILQEEGSHRTHAEAWARRLCRAGGRDRDALLERISQTWAQAARWPGPPDDAGYCAAVERGMVADRPDRIRERVRAWLVELLGGEGVQVELPEPADWSGWDAARRR